MVYLIAGFIFQRFEERNVTIGIKYQVTEAGLSTRAAKRLRNIYFNLLAALVLFIDKIVIRIGNTAIPVEIIQLR